jgi:hypothetical protein
MQQPVDSDGGSVNRHSCQIAIKYLKSMAQRFFSDPLNSSQ